MQKLSLTLFTLVLATVANAETTLEHGENVFSQNCAICHGQQGEKSALNQSAIINKLSVDEIVTALKKRKSGEIVGPGNPVKSRLNEDDMKAVAEYLQTLKN